MTRNGKPNREGAIVSVRLDQLLLKPGEVVIDVSPLPYGTLIRMVPGSPITGAICEVPGLPSGAVCIVKEADDER